MTRFWQVDLKTPVEVGSRAILTLVEGVESQLVMDRAITGLMERERSEVVVAAWA
jgi:hypothetical protein